MSVNVVYHLQVVQVKDADTEMLILRHIQTMLYRLAFIAGTVLDAGQEVLFRKVHHFAGIPSYNDRCHPNDKDDHQQCKNKLQSQLGEHLYFEVTRILFHHEVPVEIGNLFRDHISVRLSAVVPFILRRLGISHNGRSHSSKTLVFEEIDPGELR